MPGFVLSFASWLYMCDREHGDRSDENQILQSVGKVLFLLKSFFALQLKQFQALAS